MISPALYLLVAALVSAHGDHTFDLNDAADDGMSYAERHMHTEHHIDNFDLPAFFALHDLNLDGYWDVPEIEAVYGVHHHTVKEAVGGQQAIVDGRAADIVRQVLKKLDSDKDGKISLAEFEAGGKDGLPSFTGYKYLGHHYDEESEYFLHHEELYHSTPETQTDDAYNHPEDIAHFKRTSPRAAQLKVDHAHIEAQEDARERAFQGLDAQADLAKDHIAVDPLEDHAHAPGEGPSDAVPAPEVTAGQEAKDDQTPPPRQRVAPGAQPNRIREGQQSDSVKTALDEAKQRVVGGEYDGHKPRSAEERLRAGVPYKYKSADQTLSMKIKLTTRMRKGFRADEF